MQPQIQLGATGDGIVGVTTAGISVGLTRGVGGVRVRLVSGVGSSDVDTIVPVRVVQKDVVVARRAARSRRPDCQANGTDRMGVVAHLADDTINIVVK